MRLIFLDKARLSSDKLVFLFCAIAAALWITFEYGMYVGRAESCSVPAQKPAQARRA